MKRIPILAAALIVVAVPAHADPITAIATWVGGALGVGAATALAVTQFVVGFALNAVAAALMKPDVPGANVQFDVQMGDDQPLSFTVGDYATAGKRKYLGSWGRNTRFITEVIEYSALPQGLAGIWVDDERGEFIAGQRGYVSASADPAEVSEQSEGASVPGGSLDMGRPLTNYSDDGNRIWVKTVDGSQTAADPFLVWAFGSDPDYPWSSDMIGTGKSYVIITTRYDDDSLTGYPQYLIEPAPLPMYDLRLDSTNGGSGAHRWNNPATWAPTRNPAVISYNIARGIYFGAEWVYGGKNLAAWRLPAAEWIAAANECDDAVSLAEGGTEPRYRCGMEIRCNVPPADVLEEIGKAANMRFAETGGQLKPIVGLPAAAAFAFTDDDIVITEGQSFKPFYPVAETFNAISATYPEPVEKWSSKDAREYIDTDATAEDGGRYLPTSIAYGAVPYRRQIRRLMRSQMRDYRRMRRHQFHLPPDAYALEPGVDVVSWTSQRNGYVSKLFMVESVAKTPGMLVLVSLREVDPGDYDWSSSFEAPPTVVVPTNPPRRSQTISGLRVVAALVRDVGGTGRRPAIRVYCNGDEAGVSEIQIQARVLGRETTIDTTRRFGGDYSWFLTNVLPNTAYEVRARLLSELRRRSIWSPWYSVTTDNVRLGPADLDIDLIQDEVSGELADLEDWADGTGAYMRDIRDQLDAAADLSAELGAQAQLARDEIRRGIGVNFGDLRANFEERIDVLATADTAIAAAINSLNVSLNGKASASAVQALITRVTTTEGQVTAQADAITTVNAQVGRMRANGLLRISAEATPSGAQSRIGMRAEASAGDTSHSAALYLVANTDGTSNVIVSADRFAIATGDGANAPRRVPFVVDGGIVYIDEAFIRDGSIVRAMIGTAEIGSAEIENLSVGRLKIADGAVTEFPFTFTAGDVTLTPQGTWVNIQTVVFSRGRPDPLPLFIQVQQATTGGSTQYRLRRNSTVVWASATLNQVAGEEFSHTYVDSTTSTGSVTYRLDARCVAPTSTGYLRNRFLGGLNAFK